MNGIISFFPSNSPPQIKHVKITEIEYDGIEIQFTDKNYSPIDIEESDFHRIIGGDLKLNDRDYYFEILSVVFNVTAFIEKKYFHTTLWYECFIDPIKISTSLHDQLCRSFYFLEPNFYYKYIILPLDCFNSTTYSNSGCPENQNIYNVDVLKYGNERCLLFNLTIDKNSQIYNINYFRFDPVYSELYIKIYYKTSYHRIIEEYIGKNTNQCNMNENVWISYIKTNKSQDKNNKNTIQNKNNLKKQSIPENILKTIITSYNTEIEKDKNSNSNPNLINKYQH
ncbi:hypothetical protein SLOPH_1024 [Spraguea lophii 42_110]|uniref:Uncharacterized protein n=1 Tax=Spraguea lophii (strain 42_110) TaxID=1358809 RepID=S7XS66_SPRLO|nr:hypothetical protein SLOPH_1024 [Spraguea lophii 42_110]